MIAKHSSAVALKIIIALLRQRRTSSDRFSKQSRRRGDRHHILLTPQSSKHWNQKRIAAKKTVNVVRKKQSLPVVQWQGRNDIVVHANPFNFCGSAFVQHPGANPSADESSSLRGLLPTPSLPPLPPLGAGTANHVYQFVEPSPTILNCLVIAPFSQVAYSVETDVAAVGYTTIKDQAGTVMATIEWAVVAPSVEIRNVVQKRPIREWLMLMLQTNPHRFLRYMDFNRSRYAWVPQGDGIHLYRDIFGATPSICATVTRSGAAARLEITAEAVAIGLLQPCVVATVLLLSGRRLD